MIDQLKIYAYLSIIIVVIVLSGCYPVHDRTTPTVISVSARTLILLSPTSMPSKTPQATITLVSATTTPSPTITLQSPTPFPTSTPTQTPSPAYTKTLEPPKPAIPVCAGNGQVKPLPTNFGIKGALVYQKNNFNGLFAIGGTPLYQEQLSLDPKQKASVYGFSPDGEWLAYAPEIPNPDNEIVFGTPIMILLSATGEQIEQKIDVSGLEKELQDRCCCCQGYEFFDSAGEWINNNLLYIYLGARANIEGSMYSSLPKVFNPFTGTWQDKWFDDLPNIFTIYPTRGGIDHIKLSPDLSRLLYPAKSGGIILRDLDQGIEIIFDKQISNPFGENIHWSPNSKMVAVGNFGVNPEARRLLLVSRDGDITEIVNATYPRSDFFATSLSWSPDSRYLAFVDTYSNANLYLYDTRTNNYIYHCPLPEMVNGAPSLVWSPDSEWIAFSDQPNGSMRLLKIQAGEVFDILANAIPVGWSEKFLVKHP